MLQPLDLQFSGTLFEYTSNRTELVLDNSRVSEIHYLLSAKQENCHVLPFEFVLGPFEDNSLAFLPNQDVILTIASKLFAESLPLGPTESEVLSKTMRRLLRLESSLSGRK